MAGGVVGGGGGELVAALVLGVPGVALHPDELHGVGLFGGEQALPQIDVLLEPLRINPQAPHALVRRRREKYE